MSRRGVPKRIFLYALLFSVAAVYAVPMLYVVATSVRPEENLFSDPGRILPEEWRLQNYQDALQAANFGRYFLNSLFIAIVGTSLQVVFSCMAGYALARIPFKGRNLIFFLIISLLILPPQITMVPLFILLRFFPLAGGNDLMGQGGIGFLDSYVGLLTPHIVSPLGIFLMRQFYLSIPEDLADAARIDGGTEWTILWRIFTRLSLPAVVTVALFSFQEVWNDFLWPLVITRSPDLQTLQLGMTVFFQQNTTQWPLLMAGVIMASLPIIGLFFLAQRFFVSGIGTGAVKG